MSKPEVEDIKGFALKELICIQIESPDELVAVFELNGGTKMGIGMSPRTAGELGVSIANALREMGVTHPHIDLHAKEEGQH